MLIQVTNCIYVPINRIIEIKHQGIITNNSTYFMFSVIYYDAHKEVQKVEFLENSELYKRLEKQLGIRRVE